jgi:hypothetical protein
MRDFYMEITFHFESSVIPFISRVRVWKRGANLLPRKGLEARR